MKTDIQLQHDVLAELKSEPSVNAAHRGVEISDGVVTLAGHGNSYAEKSEAERAAQRVSGVKALAIEMDVKLAFSSRRTDTDIAGSARAHDPFRIAAAGQCAVGTCPARVRARPGGAARGGTGRPCSRCSPRMWRGGRTFPGAGGHCRRR